MQFAAAESQLLFFRVLHRKKSSDEGFVVLNVIWLRLSDRPHIIRGWGVGGGGNVSVQPVKHAVLMCRSKPSALSVSLMLLDAVCSYLCFITFYVLFRLFAFDQAAAELFRAGSAQTRQRRQETLGCFSFRMQDQTLLHRGRGRRRAPGRGRSFLGRPGGETFNLLWAPLNPHENPGCSGKTGEREHDMLTYVSMLS